MKLTGFLLITVLVIHVFLVLISMNQPFHGDEVAFVECARGVINLGTPIFNAGKFQPNTQCIWHIPTYVYLVTGAIYLFGENIYAIRSISAIFNLFTVFLIYLIAKELLKDNKNKELFSILTVALYALNPLTIQSSVLIDIDAGILNFSVYLFLYFFIKEKNWYYLLPSLVLVFLSKEIGAVILFLSIILTLVITLRWKKIVSTMLLFIFGGGISLFLWAVFAKWNHLIFMTPIRFNFISTGLDKNFNLFSSLWTLKSFVYFATPFFILLFCIFTVIFYKKILKNRASPTDKNIQQAILFNVTAILVIALYVYLGVSSWGFPKYEIIAMPSISIFIAFILAKSNIFEYLKSVCLSKKIVLLVLALIIMAYYFFIIGDPLLPELDSTSQNAEFLLSAGLILKSFILYALIPFLITIITLSLIKLRGREVIALILLIMAAYIYIDLMQTTVDYSTYSKYGDAGVLETVNYLKEKNISAGEVATYINIGTYLNVSGYYEVVHAYGNESDFKNKIINNPDITYLIIFQRDIERIGKNNMGYFSLETKIGTYNIFKRIS